MKNKKTIIIFTSSMFAILAVVMMFVYLDYMEKAPKPKEIIDEKVLLVYPRMTEIAYAVDSFYQYYSEKCGEECLSTPLDAEDGMRYVVGLNAFDILSHNYPSKTDLELNDVDIMDYHTLVIFHNEYVTQNVYDKITNHPNVIYLYPNSLYALVAVDYEKNEMKLVRGHGYPEKSITNGFGWKFDNSKMEKDCTEGEWNFYKINNGIMLDCYPENIIRNDTSLLQYIHDYIRR